MKIYLASDIHVSHENIMKYAKRSSKLTAQQYSLNFLTILKKTLTNDDLLIYLGDLDCGPNKNVEHLKKYFSQVPGKKIFIRGNHDTWLDDESIFYMGFSKVCDIIRYKETLFCHYPLLKNGAYPKQAPEFLKNYDLSGIKEIYHGHTHNSGDKYSNEPDGIKRINCCVDRIEGVISPLIEFKMY